MPLLNCYVTFEHMERIARQARERHGSAEDIAEEMLAQAAEKLPKEQPAKVRP